MKSFVKKALLNITELHQRIFSQHYQTIFVFVAAAVATYYKF